MPPDAKGFSPTNLKDCRSFYELYSQVGENRQQLVDDLTLGIWKWDHLLISHTQIAKYNKVCVADYTNCVDFSVLCAILNVASPKLSGGDK
ncbi:MAG: hypothetical protein IKP09_00170 [Lentisphaeria bacterium]|nr:hypothetical protein [Lentisphaeria bacterium]